MLADAETRPILEKQSLLLLHEFEVSSLEALFSQFLGGWAESISVSTTVVELDGKYNFGFAPSFPHYPCVQWRQ